jgi:solute:Na+ symporter, SSS family
MNTCVFVTAFTVLSIIYFIIGLAASQKIHTTTDYFLAGRKLGFFAVTFTLIATQLGGGFFTGMGEKSYTMGYYGILYALGMGIGFILLASGFAARLQAMNVVTTVEIFDTRYGSTMLRKIASLLSVTTMCGILIGQIISTKMLLISLLGNTPITQFFFIFFWAFVIIYTIVGGLKAVVMTDIFQLAIILFVFLGLFIYALMNIPSGWFFTDIVNTQNMFTVTLDDRLLTVLVMPALFSLIEQDLAQRFFATRSKHIATMAAVCACIVLIAYAFIPVYFGMLTRMQNIPLIPGASPLIPSIAALTNSTVVAIVFCALVAAITSTADSLLCAISSNIAQDFEFKWLNIKNKLIFSQMVTCIAGVLTFCVSYLFSQNIVDIIAQSYEISVSALFIPLVVAYFKKDVHVNAAYGSIFLGFGSFILLKFYPIFGSSLIIVALSATGYIIGSYMPRGNMLAKQ